MVDVKPGGLRRRILPPVYFFAAMGLMMALDSLWPLATLVGPPYSHLGWVPFVLALLIVFVAKRQFDRAGTTIKPFETSYSDDGTWHGPSWPKTYFAGKPALCKFYLITQVEEEEDVVDNPSIEFAKTFLPIVNESMFSEAAEVEQITQSDS